MDLTRIPRSYWKRLHPCPITGCWNWSGASFPEGYAQIAYKFPDGLEKRGHRVLYRLLVGDIPQGLVIDHLCRNRGCVNPDHMEPVTQRVNLMRGVGICAFNAKKTHCKNGHAFTLRNTIGEKAGRKCRTCHYGHVKRYWTKTAYVPPAKRIHPKAA